MKKILEKLLYFFTEMSILSLSSEGKWFPQEMNTFKEFDMTSSMNSSVVSSSFLSPEEIWNNAVLDICADEDASPEDFVDLQDKALPLIERMIKSGYDDRKDYTLYKFGAGLGEIFCGELQEAEKILSQFDGGKELFDLMGCEYGYVVC